MPEDQRPKHTHNDIERAGKIIAIEKLPLTVESVPEIEKAFLIANDWREAHDYPMRSIHASIRHYLKSNQLHNGITAARLKRMQAVRRKLRRSDFSLGLDQIQDLGGCRVILSNMKEVRTLIQILKEKLPSEVLKENDYIAKPKKDGYRSHHIIFSFGRPKATPYDGKRIEVQVRTRLQHSWATAIEAVGLFRGEELKNNQGDEKWLRLFKLMSAEFAVAERCPVAPGTPEEEPRREEIKQLEASLEAVKVLESISNGVRGTDVPLASDYKPTHYLIRYDFANKTVYVEPHRESSANASYNRAEEDLRGEQEKDVVVLVEVDKIKNLKAAYPNYFGDVELFKTQLKSVALGESAVEYSAPVRKAPVKPLPEIKFDPSWLRGTRFPKPDLRQRTKKKS